MKKLLMGSIVLTTFAVASIVFQMSSCKKADGQPPSGNPIQGLWIGTFTADNYPELGNQFYSFIVYPDGSLVTRSKAPDGTSYYSSGTWTLSPNKTFSGTIVSFVTPNSGASVTQEITATLSSNGKLIDGTWKDTINPNGTGLTGKFSVMLRVD